MMAAPLSSYIPASEVHVARSPGMASGGVDERLPELLRRWGRGFNEA